MKNLRSQVSRSGICCLGDMYTTLGKHMDNVSYKPVCCADCQRTEYLSADSVCSLEHVFQMNVLNNILEIFWKNITEIVFNIYPS